MSDDIGVPYCVNGVECAIGPAKSVIGRAGVSTASTGEAAAPPSAKGGLVDSGDDSTDESANGGNSE